MTRAYKVRASIIAVTVLVVVTACGLLITHRFEGCSLSLVFERYSTKSDLLAQDVAFLWLTNSSDRTYYLAMTGGTNTLMPDTLPGLGGYKQQHHESYMVSCEFSDQTPSDSRDLIQQASKCLALAPHSAVRLRVALPSKGQKRRVAVLCLEPPPGTRPLWTNGIGLSLLRRLPRSVAKRVMQRQPTVLRVWCDRELSHGDDQKHDA